MPKEISLKIESLNEFGYGVGYFEGKEVQVLDSLPGEEMLVSVYKNTRDCMYAEKVNITKNVDYRLEPKEDHFLACSCWQIMPISHENNFKKDIIKNFYKEIAHIELPNFEIFNDQNEYNYRNKVEFTLWIDKETSLFDLAFHQRTSKFFKYPLQSCVLIAEPINEAAQKIVKYLNTKAFNLKQLNTLMLRYSHSEKKVIACINVKDASAVEKLQDLNSLLDQNLVGIIVVKGLYASPKKPDANILLKFGDTELTQEILGYKFTYSYNNFFQINPIVFGQAMDDMAKYLQNDTNSKFQTAIDMYAGVGVIGIYLAQFVKKMTGIEVTPSSKHYALLNAQKNNVENFDFVESSSESQAEEYISKTDILIVDPPRAGMHKSVIENILKSKPKKIIYLSCNAKTQAENIRDLKEFYQIKFFKAYNFYPHTPHCETLCILSVIESPKDSPPS